MDFTCGNTSSNCENNFPGWKHDYFFLYTENWKHGKISFSWTSANMQWRSLRPRTHHTPLTRLPWAQQFYIQTTISDLKNHVIYKGAHNSTKSAHQLLHYKYLYVIRVSGYGGRPWGHEAISTQDRRKEGPKVSWHSVGLTELPVCQCACAERRKDVPNPFFPGHGLLEA